MEEAWRLMDERGYEISNLDVTLVLQVAKAHSLGHTYSGMQAQAWKDSHTSIQAQKETYRHRRRHQHRSGHGHRDGQGHGHTGTDTIQGQIVGFMRAGCS